MGLTLSYIESPRDLKTHGISQEKYNNSDL